MAWQDPPPAPRACEVCGQLYAVSAMARNPRYCTRECQIVASTAIRSQRRRERREQAEVTPDIPWMPLMPATLHHDGLCADPRTLAKAGYVWTSDSQPDRLLARRICKSCPVSMICLEWSVAALPATDNAIYAGIGAFTRRKLRGERRRPAQPQPQPDVTRETGAA
jgi:hypothetical protein